MHYYSRLHSALFKTAKNKATLKKKDLKYQNDVVGYGWAWYYVSCQKLRKGIEEWELRLAYYLYYLKPSEGSLPHGGYGAMTSTVGQLEFVFRFICAQMLKECASKTIWINLDINKTFETGRSSSSLDEYELECRQVTAIQKWGKYKQTIEPSHDCYYIPSTG